MAKENQFEANFSRHDSHAQQESAYKALVDEALDLKKRSNGGGTPQDIGAIAAVPVVIASASYPWYLPERGTPLAPPAMVHTQKPFQWRIPEPLKLQNQIPNLREQAPNLREQVPHSRENPGGNSWQVPSWALESKNRPPQPQQPAVPLDRNQKPADKRPNSVESQRPTDANQHKGDKRPEVLKLPKQADKPGQVYEMYDLKYATGKHKTPDAMVYIPDGFDPKKPVRVVVYNHGLGTDVKEAFKNSKLQEQMKGGDPNTILIVPEWQTKTQSRESRDSDRFHGQDHFKNMLDEILSKTPELAGKKTDDVASFGIITHSGGFRATESQLYKNGIYDRVNSLTVLDSMYDPKGYDKWVSENIDDLATGKKRLLVVYTDHLSGESNGLADRTKVWLKNSGHPTAQVYSDKTNPKTVTDSHTLRNRGIVFKYSTLRDPGNDAHNTMTGHYVKEVIASERR